MSGPRHGVYVKPDKLERTKVAIVGFCASSRDLAPYDDQSFEIWGLNKAYIFQPRIDRHFEMHGPGIYTWPIRRPHKHMEWLKAFPGPIYQHQADPEIPNSIAFPLEAIAAFIGPNIWRNKGWDKPLRTQADMPYITSTISYQVALAMYEGFEEIHLYGVDLNTDGEYVWQKAGVEHLLGIAAARGHKVVLPDNCPLLQGKLYGRGFMKDGGEAITVTQFETRLAALQKKLETLKPQYYQLIGAEMESSYQLEQMPPGLDAEKIDQRLKQIRQAKAQHEASIKATEGSIQELMYWISTTPEGQSGEDAIQQLRAAKPTELSEGDEPGFEIAA